MYFGANAFVPDYLVSHGRADLIGAALVALNGAQLVATLLLIPVAARLQHWRSLPYLLFGPISFVSAIGFVFSSGVVDRGRSPPASDSRPRSPSP